MRLIEQTDHYSTYERPDGSAVYLAHGFPLVYLVEFDVAWMLAQWREWIVTESRYDQHGFRESLSARLIDPDDMDDVEFCNSCNEPTIRDDGSTVQGGHFVCDDCICEDYYSCSDCEEYARDTTTTLYGEEVCRYCLNRNYSWCEDCDGYYHDNSSDSHDHDPERCCCESPDQSFAVRNDGHGLLPNDERVTVSLPAGTVDPEGIKRISRFLYEHDLYDAVKIAASLDARWQTKEGNYTKRLSRNLYKTYGEKIAPHVLSQVGCIARDHSTSTDFSVETTRDLNMSAGDFYHDESCWWQSYSESRCALKTNGGFGLRSFDAAGTVTGRAWVMPLKKDNHGNLEPTFNTETPDAFVVFNSYGQLSGYSAARILSHMAGMTYRKISFTCPPMFINGDSGYLIAPEDIAVNYTDGRLDLSVASHSDLFHAEAAAKKETVNA